MATRIDRHARDLNALTDKLRTRPTPPPRLEPVDTGGRADRDPRGDDETVILARRIYALRRRRDESFGSDLFAEPAWDILLHLYVEAGRNQSVSSVCEGAAAPATTALRKLRQLEEGGWILREDDPQDARRSFVRLSPQAAKQMFELLRGACSRLDQGS